MLSANAYLVRSRLLAPRGPARNTKLLLKELARRTFDDAFVYRRKMGFLLPLTTYFAHPRFREMMEDQFLPGIRGRGWLDEKVVRAWWGHGDTGRIHARLWLPLILEIWAHLFLDHRRQPSGRRTPPCAILGTTVATTAGREERG